VAARAARGDHNFGRASERFVSERLRRGERWGPWPLTRRLSGERPATAVTAGTEPVTAGAGVMAPGHGGHCAGHGASHGLHGAGHSDLGDGELAAGPVSAAASATGAAAFTRAGGRDKINRESKLNRSCFLGSPRAAFKTAGFVTPLHVAKRSSRIRAQAGWHFRVLSWTDFRP
jgi:hypothetical protein